MAENRELQNPKTRKFPIALLIITGIFSGIAGAWGGISAVTLSLGYLMFTMSFFLVLVSVFHRIKISGLKQDNGQIAEKNGTSGASSGFFSPFIKLFNSIWIHITTFYLEPPSEQTPESGHPLQPGEKGETKDKAAASDTANSDGLIEIRKKSSSAYSQENIKTARPVCEALYVLSFLIIAVWRLSRMTAIAPLAYTEFYYSIVDAVFMLVFPCVAATYLKLRKDEGSCPGDKTSRDILTLLSCVSLVYAAAIAITLVLDANILIVLRWVFYAAMIYLIAALAGNILLSVLANRVLGDFNYRLIPVFSNVSKTGGIFDTEEIRLNFSLKSLYTIKYTLKVFPGLILALCFVLLLSTTLFVVRPHEEAAVYRLGKLGPSSIVGEGIHFKLPWPVDRAEIFDVHRINFMQIGYESSDNLNFLWSQFHGGGEYLLLLGNGNEKVSINMSVVYNISDLYAYLKNNENPEAVLSAAAYEALLGRTVTTTLDAFLSIDRSSLSASILDELSAFSAREGLGLSVVQIIIEGIHPPADVADVYQMVVSASIERNTIITGAETEAEKILINAEEQSRSIVNYANARQRSRVSAAMQEMAVFFAAIGAHGINPRSFELTKYLDAHENVIGNSRVYVFSPGMENSIPRSVIGQLNMPGILGDIYE